jgi:hypothetical protein
MLNVVMLSVANKHFMVSAVMFSVFMLNVEAPVHMALHYNLGQIKARMSHYDIVLIDIK